MLLNVENLNIDIATANGTLAAVQDVSFSVSKGETLCIVGESGCGKSITALSLLGLLPKVAKRTARRMTFDGIDMQTLSNRRLRDWRGNRLSMIFQEPMTALNPLHTIGRQLTDVYRAHRNSSRREARERAIHLLEKVGIADAQQRLNSYPHELSGGMRQRVVIAMALMCGPELIVADEPTTALDVTIQAELLRLLIDLQKSFGMGMIMITHDLGLVSRIADRVIVMYAGQVVETAPAEKLFNNPSHPYTRALLGSVPDPSHPRMKPLPSIAGTVPSLLTRMEGCHFYDRCPLASDACRRPIELAKIGEGHEARCIKAGEAKIRLKVVA
ncbi:MAG: ABC transporter ATP-binding protein [Mesorhizobium sp.]|uniref:ABC transporter ATP-binding protein n=1 Tax=Mesorhizobium sp. TaxID=1871066 RepID=UPI000FE77C72|nr:ABC transporter ATP-binding protein [Mesorhizobium sp.]RWG50449.1 MAG: ABC transporter ATP-binding protein [Mesorhizobium sp.]RWL05206.1 MAG: ABC transporter ATP-binding protein [Mesorhizobium sp.]TIN10229.1 MAG: ABC transporter ATP-binding protein [Mesorhizobium sp.]TIQ62174.1 MAG: ABC transporter ATP-binding protein [Mesorhizobium sp.]